MEKLIESLQEIEAAADEIIADRRQMIDFDKKRQKNREAMRKLMNLNDKSVYLCFGNMFIKKSIDDAKETINKDQNEINESIEKLRIGLKEKVSHLRILEGKSKLNGYELNALTAEEIAALSDVL